MVSVQVPLDSWHLLLPLHHPQPVMALHVSHDVALLHLPMIGQEEAVMVNRPRLVQSVAWVDDLG